MPVAQRRRGYNVLPFLFADGLVARVDPKVDRQVGRLVARAIHLEPDAPDHTGKDLDQKLDRMARWLSLNWHLRGDAILDEPGPSP